MISFSSAPEGQYSMVMKMSLNDLEAIASMDLDIWKCSQRLKMTVDLVVACRCI